MLKYDINFGNKNTLLYLYKTIEIKKIFIDNIL